MEHESFEDHDVAALMNDTFVSIKVDREERPDLDAHYMTACQLMTGAGGWPLTIIMTPEGAPFFAATYIPKETTYGRMGLLDLIPRIREAWNVQRNEVLTSAQTVAAALSEEAHRAGAGELFDRETPVAAALGLWRLYDNTHGGFGSAPKFPMAGAYPLLLRAWASGRDERALRMVEMTLTAMRNGGIYDQVGFGFHRYATDAAWQVPHFEKMLYDQALLCIAYTDAWRATGAELYGRTAKEICAYVMRDLALPDGAFAAAEDADSEGEEGRFYLWTRAGVEEALPRDELARFSSVYDIDGDGRIILHRHPAETAAPGSAEELLRGVRSARPRPLRDDKVLADWNGLMIAALARAGAAFDEPLLCAAAARAADFISGRMRRGDGRLLHRYRDGEAAIGAFADDYAFLAWGFVELFEATFEERFLKQAIACAEELLAHYWDSGSGGVFRTADDAEHSPAERTKPIIDGVIPSANSIALFVFTKLAEITGVERWRSRADAIVRLFPPEAATNALSFPFFLSALDFFLGPTLQVVITGDPDAEDTRGMIRAVRSRFLPMATMVFKPQTGPASASVCTSWACTLPTNRVEDLVSRLEQPIARSA